MKAMAFPRYGPPEVMAMADIEKPVPQENELLIRVHASTVTTAEIASLTGSPFIARLATGLFKPKQKVLGVEVSGEIEAVGASVSRFTVGEQVFAYCGFNGHAEYICMAEDGIVIRKPENVGHGEAAAAVDGMLTAIPFMRDKGDVQKGDQVLINGASGSIGTFAVQLGKYYGAHVTGVCSTGNVDLVKSIGADEVIDYKKEDFTSTGQTYDVIFDTVNKSSFGKCKGALTEGGVYLTTFPTLPVMVRRLVPGKKGRKRAVFHAAGLRKPREKIMDMVFIKDLLEQGKVRSVIDRTYPLEKVPEAYEYIEKGHKKGNVVIKVSED